LRLLIEIDDDGDSDSDGVALPRAVRYEQLLAAHEPLARVERSGDDLVLWYTGGTTGLPKGVLWHQGTLVAYGTAYASAVLGAPDPESVAAAAAAARVRQERGETPVALLPTPLVHATAVHQANTWLAQGGTIVLLPRGPVDGDNVCATIERERVTS